VIVTTRPQDGEADEGFLRRLILESLTLELGADQWPQSMRDPLLEMQFHGRRHTAPQTYPDGESRIILADGVPAGWIYTADFEDYVWVAEIIVLAELRGKGVGAAVLRGVIDGAAGRPVRLTVNAFNSGAVRFYERLGFRPVSGGDAVMRLMECPAAAS
jgi:GNAT superfamily N-acetyltransferase